VAIVEDIQRFFSTTYKPGPGEFQRFEQDNLVEAIKLREKAMERGAKEQPPSDAPGLDVMEQGIAEAMRKQALDDKRRTEEQLNYYDQRLKSANPTGESAMMFATAKDAVAAFRTAMLTARSVLERDRKNDIDRAQQIKLFAIRNKLDRPPDPIKGHWVSTILLASAFVAEIGINASVLAGSSEFGIIGGIIGAFFYTFINMVVAFLLGIYALPLLNHISWAWKSIGIFGSLVALATIAWVNLLAAHYRLAVASGMTEIPAAKHASQTMWLDPLMFLGDTNGMLMVGVSLVIAFITMLKGLSWRDKYPGYAEVQNFSIQAHARWVNNVERYRAELDDIYEHHSDKIRSLQASLRDRQAMIPHILGSRRLLIQNFNSHLQHIQDVGRFLLAHYREANCETRKTPKPEYFGRQWILDGVSPIEMPEDWNAGAPENWDEVGTSLREASDELNRQHAEVVDWIEALGKSQDAAEADALVAQKRGAPKESRSERPTLTLVEGPHEAQV
jgi:hypothetical protein